ncbi:MAG TPA: hypothetical protein VHA33_28075 [Candidatus Angelobacter sp.]|nr:hypothetical protein [Candidatus Angelobacter sp.]
MSTEKISPPLSECLQRAEGDDWLELIVELAAQDDIGAPAAGRAAKIAARKEQFARQAKPVADQIRRLGGEITGEAWINGSLRIRLTKKMVPVLSDQDQVVRLDLPHAIQADV